MKKIFVVNCHDRITRVVSKVVYFSSHSEAMSFCKRMNRVNNRRYWVSDIYVFDSVSEVMSL